MPDSPQTDERAAGDPIAARCEVIEVRVADLKQLFNAIDPSPFRERDLDPDAVEFIVGWARDVSRDARLALLVHLDRPDVLTDHAAILRDAVHQFFSHRAHSARQRLRYLLRIGRKSLLIGMLVLAASIGVGTLITSVVPNLATAAILRESLLIGGWVAMWRPLEVFLYDWWPIRAEAALYDRLSTMPVRIAGTQDANFKQ